MQVGQAYKIIAEVYTLAERIEKKLVLAKKIFENESFYTFEYMNDKGNLRKETINKYEHRCNPKLIAEV